MDDSTDKSSVRSHSTVDHPVYGPICYRRRTRKPSRWSVVSRRISMMGGGRNAAMFRSSKTSTVVPPKPRLENTYKMDPDTGAGFKHDKVEQEVSVILERVLKYEEYDANCGRLAARLTELIKSKIKELHFSRHKLVVHVVIGSQQGQSLEIASQCLWNQSTDNFCSAWYQNGTLFAIATVYGVYFE
ncbi:tctex1 domain-containing protein 2-like [Anneissia japonica]|uniref:tctex1 domain-containing protein 2-like n=1 Tax=Anneissia japonica TaxID=1529436 RepID=UPI0014258400|nr:tctex1 domain-containing protein 2-like [Anneissia japonica]